MRYFINHEIFFVNQTVFRFQCIHEDKSAPFFSSESTLSATLDIFIWIRYRDHLTSPKRLRYPVTCSAPSSGEIVDVK